MVVLSRILSEPTHGGLRLISYDNQLSWKGTIRLKAPPQHYLLTHLIDSEVKVQIQIRAGAQMHILGHTGGQVTVGSVRNIEIESVQDLGFGIGAWGKKGG